MPLKIEEIQTALGLEKLPETVEEFTSEINKNYISRSAAVDDSEIASKVIGKSTAPKFTELKRYFKENGVEFTADEVKEKDIVALSKLGFEKVNSKAKEFEAKIGQPNDEVTKTLKSENENLRLKASDFENKFRTIGSEFEDYKTKVVGETKNFIKETKLNDLKKNVLVYAPDVDELKKEGFESLVAKTYKFELDEANVLQVYNIDGTRVSSKKKVGEIATPEEALKNLAIDKKVLNINPHGGKVIQTQTTKTAGQLAAEIVPQRKASNKVVRVN